ncbi:uncharacterized protein LOC18019940 [Eutrema salsugineum]|uniref:uncharacterized protein LOC18019940 n=1 Tax=Eutrema salsugineum TaxID=72664 RepID=UPI000CED6F41|nr:uncharacterized protein LOC18019940 [Eutrema salsugineum]
MDRHTRNAWKRNVQREKRRRAWGFAPDLAVVFSPSPEPAGEENGRFAGELPPHMEDEFEPLQVEAPVQKKKKTTQRTSMDMFADECRGDWPLELLPRPQGFVWLKTLL